jgi:hypothetical protein
MPDVVLDPTTRAPSGPLTGFLRSAIVSPLSVFIAAKLTKTGISVESVTIAGALMGIITASGKLLRDRGYSWAIW